MIPIPCRQPSALWAASALAFLAVPAAATPTDEPSAAAEPQLEAQEVIVTAQRRPERIQNTPVAITALDEQAIVQRKLNDIKDVVTYTPGFSGNSEDSYIDTLAIRGIVSNDYGIGGDPSIGIFKDGVYQGRTGSAVTSLFDIERAEALRGPQGFLFGRNAISGAINIVTNKPDTERVRGHVYLGYGEVDRVEAEAALNLPLSEHWALRVAGYHTASDGWVDNVFTPDRDDRLMGENRSAARAALLYTAGPLRVIAMGEYERRRLDGTPYRASNELPPGPPAYAETVKKHVRALGAKVVFEPGRLIAANAGVLVSEVIYVKEEAGRTFVIADAAMNDLIRPTLYEAWHEIRPVVEPDAHQDYAVADVVGPVCESGDFMAKERSLPAMKPGDLFAVASAGAYGAVQAGTYNTRPLVPEVLVKGSDYAVIRPRMSVEEIIALDRMPAWLT